MKFKGGLIFMKTVGFSKFFIFSWMLEFSTDYWSELWYLKTIVTFLTIKFSCKVGSSDQTNIKALVYLKMFYVLTTFENSLDSDFIFTFNLNKCDAYTCSMLYKP